MDLKTSTLYSEGFIIKLKAKANARATVVSSAVSWLLVVGEFNVLVFFSYKVSEILAP